MGKKRVYLVTQKVAGKSDEMTIAEWLIRAELPSQALRFVVKDSITVRIADAEDGARLASEGQEIEDFDDVTIEV